MEEFNVAVVDCSLPTDHEDHVTYRPATDAERAEAQAVIEPDAAPPTSPTIEERLAALEAKS